MVKEINVSEVMKNVKEHICCMKCATVKMLR